MRDLGPLVTDGGISIYEDNDDLCQAMVLDYRGSLSYLQKKRERRRERHGMVSRRRYLRAHSMVSLSLFVLLDLDVIRFQDMTLSASKKAYGSYKSSGGTAQCYHFSLIVVIALGREMSIFFVSTRQTSS